MADRKTQTRRAIKFPEELTGKFYRPEFDLTMLHDKGEFFVSITIGKTIRCPYGKIGDVLWVRESFRTAEYNTYRYKADFSPKEQKSIRWKPSIFMPKEAARIWLQITNIRVEKLHDISKEDAANEGLEVKQKYLPEISSHSTWYQEYNSPHETWNDNPIEAFKTLWESINGLGSWNYNPWVWVVEFKGFER